jgi:Calcineurin-like phosphoesterase
MRHWPIGGEPGRTGRHGAAWVCIEPQTALLDCANMDYTSSSRRLRKSALFLVAAAFLVPRLALSDPAWHFAVSGDSRNCGDVVMPSIADGARENQAKFYWHLGDLRAIFDFDEDFQMLHPKATISEYLGNAWLDFQQNQVEQFGPMPFFLGIGNHDTLPPKTRDEFALTFADWLNVPVIREQRLKDNPHDYTVRTYYHWIRDGIDFINLDNATPDQFDFEQIKWLSSVLQHDRQDSNIRALVVGMHEALPESLTRGHSMSENPSSEATGIIVYEQLLEIRKTKPVYVLASHSHFVMEGIFDTPYWRQHGGVLPGWIIGTAGAFRYALPPGSSQAKLAKSHVYGYLLAKVSAPGEDVKDPIHFKFQEVTEAMVRPEVIQRFSADFVHHCYQDNAQN